MPTVTPAPPGFEPETPPPLAPVEEARKAALGDRKHDYVQGMFSDIAPRYDLLNHVLSMNIDKGWRRRALVALQWARTPNGRFLDLCAGTLDVGAALTRERGFAGRIVGADFALPMLQHGARKASAAVLWPVAADALRLPLADASMDGAIVAFGIRNVTDLEAALSETHRVLCPGARFVILEFSTPPSRAIRLFYHFYFHHVLPAIGRMVSGHKSAYTYLPLSVAQFPTGDALAGRLRNAGFVDVSWESLTFGIAAIHVATKGVPATPRT